MPTNLDLDDDLVRQARESGGHRTKRDAVNAALAEYVTRRRAEFVMNAIRAFDEGGWGGDLDSDYDFREARRASLSRVRS